MQHEIKQAESMESALSMVYEALEGIRDAIDESIETGIELDREWKELDEAFEARKRKRNRCTTR